MIALVDLSEQTRQPSCLQLSHAQFVMHDPPSALKCLMSLLSRASSIGGRYIV